LGVPLRGRIKALMRKEKPLMKKIVLLKNTYLYVKKIPYKQGKLVLCYNEEESSKLKNLILRRNIKANVSLLGTYAIFSSEDICEEEIVKRYFERDIIERSFKCLKGVLGLRPIRHWLESNINGHVFICYLAYLFLILLQRKLRKTKISVNEALDELRYVYEVITEHGVEKIFAPTKKQKKILKLLKINL